MDFDILKDILPKSVPKWNQEDVYIWLKFIYFQTLFETFQQNHIDGKRLLQLTNRELRGNLQIQSQIKRKKLLSWIQVGLHKYSQFLRANDLNSDDQNSCRSSIFCSKVFRNQSESEISYHQASDQENQKGNQNSENLSQTNKNAFAKNKTQQDVRRSVKKSKPAFQKRQLILTDAEKLSKECFAFINKGGSIGRSSNNQIFVVDMQLQQVHCVIQFQRNDFFLQPFNRKSKTWIKIMQKVVVDEDIVAQIGSQIIQISLQSDKSISISKNNGQNSPKKQSLYVLSGREGNILKIGRNRNNQLAFASDQSMSGFHAKMYFSNNVWVLEDLNSTNGTWLQLKQNKKLQDGTVFKMGRNAHSYMCRTKTNDRYDGGFKDYQNSWQCVQCRENVRNCYYLPCFHSCLCQNCSQAQSKCHVCDARIIQTIYFFTS